MHPISGEISYQECSEQGLETCGRGVWFGQETGLNVGCDNT